MTATRKKKTTTKSAKTTRKKTAKAGSKSTTSKTKSASGKSSGKASSKKSKGVAKASAVKQTAASKKVSSFPVGSVLPDFGLEGTSGENFRLSGAKGRKVVLYFYPKDSTPGCTIEGNDFGRLHSDFQKAGADVYGISRDSLKSHENFKAKQGFPFELLTDGEETLCNLFDVIREKQLYGRKFMGIERSTFLIDSEGRLVAEWRGVKVPGHAEEVLRKVKELG